MAKNTENGFGFGLEFFSTLDIAHDIYSIGKGKDKMIDILPVGDIDTSSKSRKNKTESIGSSSTQETTCPAPTEYPIPNTYISAPPQASPHC